MPEGQIPPKYYDLLEGNVLAHLATVGEDGRPQVNPVWILWEDDEIHISVLAETRKLRNMQTWPHVALSLLDPQDDRRYLELRGIVTGIDRYDDLGLVNRLSRKYTGTDYKFAREDQVRFHVTVRVQSWTAQG